MSLYRLLLLYLILPVIFVTILIISYSHYMFEYRLKNQLMIEIDDFDAIAKTVSRPVWTYNSQNLKNLITIFGQKKSILALQVNNNQGQTISDFGTISEFWSDDVIPKIKLAPKSERELFDWDMLTDVTQDRWHLNIEAPILKNDLKIGNIQATVSLRPFKDVLDREQLEIIISILVMIAFVSIFLGLFVRYEVLAPTSDVSKASENIGKDTLESVTIRGKSREFRQLETLVNQSIESIKLNTKQQISLKRAESIAATTQMLAHDVRKPFTMLQGVMSMLVRADSLEESQMIIKDSIPEINRGIRSVNGMIQDVMEVGSSGELSPEAANPETLIETTLLDTFRYRENVKIDFSYDLHHGKKVNVDIMKTSRVFANIVGNAAQAMKYKGKMWFNTHSVEGGMIQFTIGNSDSYIPPEKMERLFEAFYTSGKKGGTGLGLAIVKKVVEGHGGKVWCTSSEVAGTEFHFTLPSLSSPSRFDGVLPESAAQIRAAIAAGPVSSQKNSDKSEYLLEQSIIDCQKESGKNITALLVDDECLYTRVLENQLAQNAEVAAIVTTFTASSGEQAIAAISQSHFDIIVLDVDMGQENINGFETARRIRSEGYSGLICIHSNRGGPEYHKEAMTNGADMFINKTMPREHFLRLILSVLGGSEQHLGKSGGNISPKVEPKQDKILLIDDEAFFHKHWQRLLGKDKVHSFYSYKDLKAAMGAGNTFRDCWAVVTDFYLQDMYHDGTDVSQLLTDGGVKAPIFLSTNATDPDIAGTPIRKVVSKIPSEAVNEIKDFCADA